MLILQERFLAHLLVRKHKRLILLREPILRKKTRVFFIYSSNFNYLNKDIGTPEFPFIMHFIIKRKSCQSLVHFDQSARQGGWLEHLRVCARAAHLRKPSPCGHSSSTFSSCPRKSASSALKFFFLFLILSRRHREHGVKKISLRPPCLCARLFLHQSGACTSPRALSMCRLHANTFPLFCRLCRIQFPSHRGISGEPCIHECVTIISRQSVVVFLLL
jgi:hypothetical protein